MTIDSDFFALLTSSYERAVGTPLPGSERGPEWLYNDAPYAVLSHNTDADPRFVYGNRTAQSCFEYSWDEITALPSRLSAEAPNRAERQRLLDEVSRNGYVSGYQGVRVAKSGRRFRIEDGVVWQLIDAAGVHRGQAAMFPSWKDVEPQPKQRTMIAPLPAAYIGTGVPNPEHELLAQLATGAKFMMGDNPALPKMPREPRLLDFFRLRFGDITYRHLLHSAKLALDEGHEEPIVLACLLHDISMGGLMRTDHGYWGAQLIAPYVSEEIAWAVQHHQALRYFADESVGYSYPQSYIKFFGEDYVPPAYIQQAHDYARQHRWYMSARLITINDIYSFDTQVNVDPDIFTDIIGRHFKQPKEGLGFDGSPVAHMWRTMIWPNNFL